MKVILIIESPKLETKNTLNTCSTELELPENLTFEDITSYKLIKKGN